MRLPATVQSFFKRTTSDADGGADLGWLRLMRFVRKFKGQGAPLPPMPGAGTMLRVALGGFCAIGALAVLTDFLTVGLLLGSFGSSCVLMFGFPDQPFAQPRNVVAGHVISSFSGLLCMGLFGYHAWVVALAVALAIVLMMVTRTLHPPAGSNPVIVFLLQPAWNFLLFPTLFGAVAMVLVALVYNNAARNEKYPKYW